MSFGGDSDGAYVGTGSPGAKVGTDALMDKYLIIIILKQTAPPLQH